MSNSPPIDKQQHYGEFMASQRWRDRLANKLAHKAVDIRPDEEMNVDNRRFGMTWKEMAVIIAGMLGAAWLYTERTAPIPPEPPAQQTVEPIRGKLRFYLPDGKEVPTVERHDD